MADIKEILTQTNLQDYVDSRPIEDGLLNALFPEVSTDEFKLEYIVGADSLPVAASVHATDSETEIGDRESLQIMEQDFVSVRRKIDLNAKDAQIIATPRHDGELNSAIAKLYDDAENVYRSVWTAFKVMAYEMLSTGKIVFNGNDYRGTVNYKLPTNHVIKSDDTLLDPNVNPLELLRTWQSTIKTDTGTKPTRILTSERILSAILNSAAVRKGMYGVNSERLVTETELNTFLNAQGLPTIYTYDESYRKKVKGEYKEFRFIPEDTLIMFPEGALGTRTMAVTDEELILRNSGNISKRGNITMGTWDEMDPPKTWTKASGKGLPSFPQAKKVMIVSGLLDEYTPPAEEPETP